MSYVITGTNKKTSKREVISGVKNTKTEVDALLKHFTFGNWKNLPDGMSKQQAQEYLAFKNMRVKKI